MPRTFCYDEAEDIFYIDGMGYTGAFFDAVNTASQDPVQYTLRRDEQGRVTFAKEEPSGQAYAETLEDIANPSKRNDETEQLKRIARDALRRVKEPSSIDPLAPRRFSVPD